MARRKTTGRGNGAGAAVDPEASVQFVPISDETRRRYLNYAAVGNHIEGIAGCP